MRLSKEGSNDAYHSVGPTFTCNQSKGSKRIQTIRGPPSLTKDHRVNGRVIVARGVEVSRDNLARGLIQSASDEANAARPDAEDIHALVQSEGSPTPELLGLLHLRENRRLYLTLTS
jgi:hypothetical protein